MRRIIFIAEKEFHHILRDPRSLTIAIIMPVLMTFLFGYAINMDIEHIALALVDLDQTPLSRELGERFYESNYFRKPQLPVDFRDPERILKRGKAGAVLIIRQGFSEAVARNEKFELGVMVDGSDNNVSAAVKNYSEIIVNDFMRDLISPEIDMPVMTLSVQVLYNPDLKSAYFFVPGLVAVILMMISALLTSITLAREKETGTMENLLTSPVKPHEIITGKIIPYVLIALIDGVLVLALARIVFGVPFVGSKMLLLGVGLLYIVTSLSLGILISALVKTQQVAMMLAQVATVLPSVMLSGYIFDIKNMPVVLQALSYVIPAKYFLKMVRGIMLKGAGFEVLYTQAIFLVLLTGILVVVAAKKFRARAA